MKPDFRAFLRRALRFLKWTLCIAVVVFGVKYCFEAKARACADSNPERWWTEVSKYPNWDYTAKRTFIGRETILLRLYRTGDSTLLAERVYMAHGVALLWTHDGWLIYDTADTSYEGGMIELPPTRLDRFLAKLP